MNKQLYILKKYSNELTNLFNHNLKIINCQKEKCSKEFKELESLKQECFKKIAKLHDEEVKTVTWKKYDKNRKKILEKYHNNPHVKKQFYNLKNNIKSDAETLNNAKKEFAIYQKEHKQNMKDYLKTAEKKYYEKETKKILNTLYYNTKTVNVTKCSFKECYELHKHDLMNVKSLVNKFCKEKMKKSCKIAKTIDKIDISKFNYKDSNKLIKMIRKGMY